MSIFDELFDFDGDGKMGLLDMFLAHEAFAIFNEACDLKEGRKAHDDDEEDGDDGYPSRR